MTNPKTLITAAAITASLLTGGVVGAVVLAPLTASAATATPTPTATSTSGSAPAANASPGTFKPNEDATHEKGESAAREAQEDAGQMPTVP